MEREGTGSATERLLDRVRQAVGTLGPFDDAVEEADAHRHVLRLLSAALDLHVERADPARPLPTVWMSPTRKFLGDSPDTVYTTVPVSADHTYRLIIDPGVALYVGLVAYGRDQAGGSVHIVDSVLDDDLVRVDGRFAVEVGAQVAPGDPAGIHLDSGAFRVMVRHYLADPTLADPAAVQVERTDGPVVDGPPDPRELAAAVGEAADWVVAQLRADAALDALMLLPDGVGDGVVDRVPTSGDLVSVFHPTPDIAYQGCRAVVEPGQRLEISFTPPPCRFWSVTVCTPWLESIEQRVLPASVNSERFVANDDGRVVVVVSGGDPEVPNWIPLRGYRRIQVAVRFLLAESPPERASYLLLGSGRGHGEEPSG
ncbi:MAG TPA: DUF1214 domain-containing protein [Acidimicrobiales bacterium]|nr:DUF1214 domain-containing protein [Acidimicrobiales bacterium]